jgi:uncharacterized protein
MYKSFFSVLLICGSFLLPADLPASTQSVIDTSASPFAALRSVNLDDVQWTSGFWADRFATIKNTTLKHLYELAADPERGAIQNLEISAGIKDGAYTGNNWMDAWVYKWLEAAAAVYATTQDEELDRLMDRLIEVIAKAQEKDGYIATQNSVRKRSRFQEPKHHEVYVMGHLLTAAALHHRFTGKTNFLDIAKKTGDFLYRQFSENNQQMAHFPFNPSVVMGAVELYRITQDSNYLELAKMVVDLRGKYKGGSDQSQDRIPLRDETEVVGHAVFYTYLFAGAADLYMETGEDALRKALERLWEDLVAHKLYITGGTCPLYRGFSVRNGKLWNADEVHEAAAAKYYLPNTPAYNETCGQVGNFMWNWRMLAITGDEKYADIMEREMFNGFLPGISLDGKSFIYTNPLRWFGHEHDMMGNDSRERHLPGKGHGTCCPTNVLRTLTEMQNFFYSTSDDGLWIHHYGGNILNNDHYHIIQETEYPWDGDIQIKVAKSPRNSIIHLRIPPWAEGYTIQINGNEYSTPDKTGIYVQLRHEWKDGDQIQVHFPMKTRLIRAHRRVDSTHNQIAVLRGPLVYCLESPDLPDGVDVSEIIIPRDIELAPRRDENFLGGAVTLNGQALRMPKDDSQLYTEIRDQVLEPVQIKLIPYYAWFNRGVSQMSVWLPIDW